MAKKSIFSAKKAKNQARKNVSEPFFACTVGQTRAYEQKKRVRVWTLLIKKIFVSDPRETQIVLQSWSVPYIIQFCTLLCVQRFKHYMVLFKDVNNVYWLYKILHSFRTLCVVVQLHTILCNNNTQQWKMLTYVVIGIKLSYKTVQCITLLYKLKIVDKCGVHIVQCCTKTLI